VPYTLETKVLPAAQTAQRFRDPPVPTEKITIEKVVLNPNLEESLFTKPEITGAPKAK
jgi:hypothetical protein